MRKELQLGTENKKTKLARIYIPKDTMIHISILLLQAKQVGTYFPSYQDYEEWKKVEADMIDATALFSDRKPKKN